MRLRFSLVIALLCPVSLRAEAPVGPEFQVNEYTTGLQSRARVAADASGSFVVVWVDYSGLDGSDAGVFARRFDAAGLPIGDEFQVNSYTTGFQYKTAVASDGDGDFVVAWSSADGPNQGIFARRFTGTGAEPEFRVNELTAPQQTRPSVSSDADGNVVFVWESNGQDGNSYGVFGRRMDSDGILVGSEFQVNTYTTGTQFAPAVASNENGDFVVVWNSIGQDAGTYGVYGQRFNASGTPRGSEFRVNSYTTGIQRSPGVAASGGGFIVVWESAGQDGSGLGVFRRSFSFIGLPVGAELQVNVAAAGDQKWPVVARGEGLTLVTWASVGQDGSSEGVFGRWFGGGSGGEFRVNTHTTSSQRYPSVSARESGKFVVAWQSFLQDGDDDGIFAQRYADLIFGNGFQPSAGP